MNRDSAEACEVWQLLLKFVFSHRAYLPPLAAKLQLSPAQCHVLKMIEPGHPVAMGQLADSLACHASNVTGLVDRLESRGLVRRHASARDRRVKVLDLTPSGCRLRAIMIEYMTQPPESIGRLSTAEQRALGKILRHLEVVDGKENEER